MPDRGHHGEGEHHQGDVTVPAMPGSALVVIEPELVFRGFKAVLDRPSMAFDRDHSFAANRPRLQGSVSMPVDEAATFGYPRERSFLNSGSKTFGYPRQAP